MKKAATHGFEGTGKLIPVVNPFDVPPTDIEGSINSTDAVCSLCLISRITSSEETDHAKKNLRERRMSTTDMTDRVEVPRAELARVLHGKKGTEDPGHGNGHAHAKEEPG